MLELKEIVKTYVTGDTTTHALNSVDLTFGEKEFVSILGTSGSGKTTMLNIIGGLDTYDSGDLIINGKSTKKYTQRDWDTYRNHSIGFVFQSYNLIPHQSVLSNVELALTLSGVSKSERKKRAKEALEMVGLGDQLKKKPSQMSGGQMQRVAIARALVNDPDILLADEPTGALDTETSVQIMDILKKISESKLVIMVTHNPDLASTYSTRIVKLSDGKIISDEPNTPSSVNGDPGNSMVVSKSAEKKERRTSMSFFTAFSLSLNNLMTKKARTILTAFAGSIGIIGIALILSVSNGVQNYIDDVQEDTLSSYPISIMRENMDIDELLETLSGETEPGDHENNRVYSSAQMSKFFNTLKNTEKTYNDLKKFKVFLDTDEEIREYISAIQYSYQNNLLIYRTDENGKLIKVNPSPILDSMQNAMGVSVSTGSNSIYSQMSSNSMKVWAEMIPGKNGEIINDLVKEQYDIIGAWPEKAEEVVLIMNKNNEISDVFLYSLGLLDQDKLEDAIRGDVSEEDATKSWSYDELLGLEFYAVLPSSVYSDTDGDGIWTDMTENEDYMKIICDSAIKVKITGIVKPNEEAVATSMRGAIGYTHALTELVINETNESEIVKAQKNNVETDIFTGLPFKTDDVTEPTASEKAAKFTDYASSLPTEKKAELYVKMASTIPDEMLDGYLAEAMKQYPDRASMEAVIIEAYSTSSGTDPETVKEYISGMSDEDIEKSITEFISAKISADYAEKAAAQLAPLGTDQLSMMLDATVAQANGDEAILSGYFDKFVPSGYSESTYDLNIKALSAMDLDDPAMINIYSATFEAKDDIAELIDKYNKKVGEDSDIQYTDYVAIIMSSVTTIINAISYVLIAFVSISLVVSSIMIGIITYISVLERTKEIGILRAIGASKKDISRVFNAETLIVGLTAGVIGIGVTLLLCIPINIIIQTLSGIPNLAASLPPLAGVILVGISILLTVFAGLIPSRLAAKKDPVESLRSE